MKTILVTGGLGFIGSRFVKMALHDGYKVVNVDLMTYAAVQGCRFYSWYPLDKIRGSYRVELDRNHTLFQEDVAHQDKLDAIFQEFHPQYVVHFAAESHVDRSIDNSDAFLWTNVRGTHVLLECLLKHGGKMVHVSTDEVYGPWSPHFEGIYGRRGFREEDKFNPRNPYAATKAAAEHLVSAYRLTYGLDVCITRGVNTYGEYQHPEKFLPLFIQKAAENKPMPLYGDGGQVREWLHVADHCRAIFAVMERGESGQAYNVSAGQAHTNIQVATRICHWMQKPTSLITHVPDRPGHDREYRINPDKLQTRLGWDPVYNDFIKSGPAEDRVYELVAWYADSVWGKGWRAHVGDAPNPRRGTRQ